VLGVVLGVLLGATLKTPADVGDMLDGVLDNFSLGLSDGSLLSITLGTLLSTSLDTSLGDNVKSTNKSGTSMVLGVDETLIDVEGDNDCTSIPGSLVPELEAVITWVGTILLVLTLVGPSFGLRLGDPLGTRLGGSLGTSLD
jgi:hypothetical protein